MQTKICGNCGSAKLSTSMETISFPYGTGSDAATLTARIPVHKCGECGFQFRDSEADDLMHEAVCRHLGIMTPEEIRAIRDHYGLARKSFAEATRIGEASLGRWEAAAITQNAAMDSYLYLLTFPENFYRVRERDNAAAVRLPGQAVDYAIERQRFKHLSEEDLKRTRAAANKFELLPS